MVGGQLSDKSNRRVPLVSDQERLFLTTFGPALASLVV
jgi:hypothetical protein